MPLISYSGPSAAATFTAGVLNAKWDKAVELMDELRDRLNAADAIVVTAPQMGVPSVDQTYLPPVAPILSGEDAGSAEAMYRTALAEIEAQIQDGFSSFLATNFPDSAYYQAADAWLAKAITEGGTGINTAVENALWERGRARVLTQAQRDIASTEEKYARAGWPLPPGAMLHDVALIRQDSRDKLAEQSRDIAIKSFETEIENIRFAVTKVLELRVQAISAAGDYIKTLVLGPQTAMQLSTGLAGLKTEFARSLVALYSAESQALEPRVRLAITDAQLKAQGNEANLRANVQAQGDRVQMAISDANRTASMLAAMLNAISASTAFTGSEAV